MIRNKSPISANTDFLSGENAGAYLSLIYFLLMLPAGLIFHNTGSYHISSENDFFSSYVPHSIYLLEGNFTIDVYRGPFYVFFLSGVKSLVGNYLQAGVIISTISASIFLFIVYKTASIIFSRRTAFFVILFTAVNPVFVKYTFGAGTDMFFIALAGAAVYFLLSDKKGHWGKIAAAASFTAFAFLTRYNAAFLLAGVPVSIILLNIFNRNLKERLLIAIYFLIIFSAIISPWGIYTFIEKGEFFYNENYRNIAISLGSTGTIDWNTSWNQNSAKFDSFIDIIKDDGVLLLKTILINIVHHAYKMIFEPNIKFIGLLALLGLFYFKKNKIPVLQKSYYLINICFFIMILPVFYDDRFSLMLVPLISLLAFWGSEKFSKILKAPLWIILFLFIFYSAVAALDYNSRIITGAHEIPKVTEKFKNRDADKREELKIASQRPHISYHLNMQWEHIPYDKTLDETISILKKKNVDYLFISRIEYHERRQLKKLLNSRYSHPDLKPVIYLPDESVVLYKILNTEKSHLNKNI